MHYFSGLRPADSFIVHTNYVQSPLSEDVLKRLYIPLIGLESIAVYQYLSQFINGRQVSEPETHYLILNELKMNLSHFEQLRERLEAIGLLKTFLKTGEAQCFVYKLISPVMPAQFFNDPMLSVFLFQVVGKERFHQLKKHFCTDTIDLTDYRDVSKNYMDVFGTPKEPDAGIFKGNETIIKTNDSLGIPVHQQTFDFDLLEMLLNQNLITREQLPKATRDLITQLSVLYDIAPTEMRRIILRSLSADQTISHEELRKNARDFYQLEHEGNLPALTEARQPDEVEDKTQLSWFEMMDTTSPVAMLASTSKSEPTARQKRMIESIVEREKLPFGVINILLQYVMFTHDMQLPQSYIEEIASNWKKLKFESSRQAYDHVKKLQKQQAERQSEQKPRRTRPSYEKTPAWVSQMKEGSAPVAVETDQALEAEKRKLEEELKNFWKEDER
ncbi:replication initiation and membrane attachment family protein [Macrococcus equipercicus]|uniref:DnaD domain protein n=1 Tax=Macrococcus equipercicus TaxID=69967 RepID=A0A9Q9F0U0_9STAP|nr:DnaD domain protein [Macrococcus equipercicus]KAA1039916.1 hypothetical protein ERX35_002705 [Macrococcus equipercicus]UTH13135.1 DnaD domain protein [Macrococcus equipercicus]